MTLEPDLVLLIFLPAILYRESLTISLREIRANLPVIGLLAVVLVVLTMVTVSFTAQAFGVNPRRRLGARRGPRPDRRGGGHRPRQTAAPEAPHHSARGEPDQRRHRAGALRRGRGPLSQSAEPGVLGIGEEFVGASVGGVVAGLLVGAAVVLIRQTARRSAARGRAQRADTVRRLPARRLVHASGVLAVVVAGLVLAYAGPRVIRARSRVLAYAFWDLSTFLINGGLFVLLGTQIPRAVRGITSTSAERALLIVVVVTLVVVGTRLLFVYLTAQSRGCGAAGSWTRARGRRAGGWGQLPAGPVSGAPCRSPPPWPSRR